MVTLQAIELAALGFRVIVFDLSGTGDSEGEFGDALWEHWLEDVDTIIGWVKATGSARCSVLGIRMGGLLAVEASALGARNVDGIVLWHPCTNGRAFLQQFLRLRMARSVISGQGVAAESVADLQRRLGAGESLEIAGYDLSPRMASAIQQRSLQSVASSNLPQVRWMDLTADSAAPLPAGTTATVEKWRELAIPVTASAVVGPPFWSLQEITVVPGLLSATTETFRVV